MKFKNYEEVKAIAEGLIGTPISEFYKISKNSGNKKDKGRLGNIIQKVVFGISPNSKPQADFLESGLELELKVIPFKKMQDSSKKSPWGSKERLVLNMINYEKIPYETFETSHLFLKNQHIQFLAYWDHPGGHIISAYQLHWNNLPHEIKNTIREDFYKIQSKIKSGEAHLLSESETTILAAARKGAGRGRDQRKQPFSPIPANSRVFSIKPRYVSTLFYHMNDVKKPPHQLKIDWNKTGDDYVQETLRYLLESAGNLDLLEYNKRFLGYPEPKKVKTLGSFVVKDILKRADEEILRKLELYGYKLRTITIDAKDRVQESIPLPQVINPEEMLSWNTSFEESDVFHQLMDYKFIFVPILKSDGRLTFQKPFIFYFDENDSKTISNLRHVWSETREMYSNPIIKRTKTNKNGKQYHTIDFVKKGDKRDFHVRPKARNSNHLYKIGKDLMILPHAFWINSEVIEKAYRDSKVQSKD